jgi:2-polyprenyl-3-methyl-5-hydroxy-6-metoxy-1,4-benzoquinol methylase
MEHDQQPPLYSRIAAAYVRGALCAAPNTPDTPLIHADLTTLDPAQLAAVIALGREHGVRLHRFKQTMGLARVARVLGALHGLAPSNLLDIGSGRGAFLWPLLDAFPWLPVTAIDILPHRVTAMQHVAAGGITTLTALPGDATNLPFPAAHFDVITLLEVLEHIPATHAALAEVLRVARRFVVLSVPSQSDDNPEHVHLFDAVTIERLLRQHGAVRVRCEYVPGHLIVVAKKA